MEDEAVEVQEGVVVGCWVLGVVGVGVVYEGLAEEARVTACVLASSLLPSRPRHSAAEVGREGGREEEGGDSSWVPRR